MDKIEQYLDQVCRGIGGPRALRQHIRQELREHLRDAVAERKATGLSEAEALERALEDFGGPEQMRNELEATHGYRLVPVLIDRAMQWKEQTMRAKWLWMTWAHLAVVGVLALVILWITFSMIFLLPKSKKLMHDGVIDVAHLRDQGFGWMPRYADRVAEACDHATWWLILALVAVVAFEFGVQSEHKSYIRLSLLGTAATGLMVVAALLAGVLIIPFQLTAPPLAKATRQLTQQHVERLDASLRLLESGFQQKRWDGMLEDTVVASTALQKLDLVPYALAGKLSVDEVRASLEQMKTNLEEARQAIRDKDAQRLQDALNKLDAVYQPLRAAAQLPAKGDAAEPAS